MTSSSGRYVCAFRGRRDYYQVPLALADADVLDQFITDAYAGPVIRSVASVLPAGIRSKLDGRIEPKLSGAKIKCLWATTAVEHLRHRLGYARSLTYAKLDRRFSLAAARRARESRSNLFLYSPYAWEAFTTRYRHSPRKVLFQFHPHPDTEKEILVQDRTKYPFVQSSFEEEVGEQVSDELKRRNRDCWKHADLILCASSFTFRSLLAAGADGNNCIIIPYGIDLPDVSILPAAPDRFSALFVGTGTQRKGLHHLLMAWQRANLPPQSSLTLVCRTIDPSIADMAQQMRGVEVIPGIDAGKLGDLFALSSLFVMPSLVEGFGQVYLEALAHGCPVLGTANSGLPELGGEEQGIWQIEPGNVDQLTATLETLARILPGNCDVRRRAQACAAARPWARFRDDICRALR